MINSKCTPGEAAFHRHDQHLAGYAKGVRALHLAKLTFATKLPIMFPNSAWKTDSIPKYWQNHMAQKIFQTCGVTFLINSSRRRCSPSVQASLAVLIMRQMPIWTIVKAVMVYNMRGPANRSQQNGVMAVFVQPRLELTCQD